MVNQTTRAAMITFLVRWSRLWTWHNHYAAVRNDAESHLKTIEVNLQDCKAAFRQLGHDVDSQESWQGVQAEYAEDWKLALEEAAKLPPQTPNVPEPAPESISEMASAPEMPRIADIVIERLKEAGDKGTRAAVIRTYIEAKYSRPIHEKTVGMTLFRLRKKGLVRRDKQTWFITAHDKAAKKNPGVATPGLFQTEQK
jgi:ribonuclease D